MAAAAWPASLPQDLRIPSQHQPGKQTIRTQMDAGPQKVRRRYSAAPQNFTTTVVMNGTQYQAFLDFYNDTLKGGSLRFDWEHPATDATVEMRFRGDNPPQGQVQKGGSTSERTWVVNLELEIMP